jgi:uncharacterized membrane protein
MHSLENEIAQLRQTGAGATDLTRAAALESGQVFSLHRELLVTLYASVAAVMAGVSLLIAKNLDRIGPMVLLAGLLVAAGLCYLPALRARLKHQTRSIAGDYLLLLAALLLSAAVGYAEAQFHFFGEHWQRHLLWLAGTHLLTAYLLDSRLVLSVALTSFAGWLGIETRFVDLWDSNRALTGIGYRALGCAAAFLGARELHRNLARRERGFTAVHEQFALHFAFWGLLSLVINPATSWLGFVALLPLAMYVGWRGYHVGSETSVLYAIGYATIGIFIMFARLLDDELLQLLLGLGTIVGAVMLLWKLRAKMKDDAS